MKKKTMKRIVLFVLGYLVLFSIAMTVVYIVKGDEPDSLIQWTYTVFGIELMATMVKKIMDNRKGGNSNEGQDY